MVLKQSSDFKCCHDATISKLKNVDGKHKYEGVEFPVSYEAISAFEEINAVCIFNYDFGTEGKLILRQQGR